MLDRAVKCICIWRRTQTMRKPALEVGGVHFCSADCVKVYSKGIPTSGDLKTGIVSPFTAPRKSGYQLNWLLLLQFASLTQDTLPFSKAPTRVTSKVAFKPGTDGWNLKSRKWVYWQV